MKKYLGPRLLAAALSLLLPVQSVAGIISGQAARGTIHTAAPGTVGAGLSAPHFLRSLNMHLDRTAARLGSQLPALTGLREIATPAMVAEYLSRAALGENADFGSASVEAVVAARLIGGVLAEPELRAEALRLLARGDEKGRRVAAKLKHLGRSVSGEGTLKRLSRDLRTGPQGVEAWRTLAALFDGERSGENPGWGAPLSTPESFAAYAARRFMAGAPGYDKGPAVLAPSRGPMLPRGIASDEELHDRIALSPLTNAEREAVIVDLFRQAGASPEEIMLQDIGRGRSNVYAVKKGRTDRVVVVGGHHDKVSRGHGTIDNWTGATMAVNLYQAMRDVDTEATYVFVAFGREEEGLIGSKQFVRSLSRVERRKVDAMVNLDTLAVDGTFSWKNNSEKILLDMIRRVAGEKGFDLAEMRLWGGDADSSSFRRAGIPAMTVLGASNDVIWDIIHSERDNIHAFSLPHYKNAYLLTLALLKQLDLTPARGSDLTGRAQRRSGWLISWMARLTARLRSWLS